MDMYISQSVVAKPTLDNIVETSMKDILVVGWLGNNSLWWYKTMPFSTTFAPITYTRKITDSINGKTLTFKGCTINQDIRWELI